MGDAASHRARHAQRRAQALREQTRGLRGESSSPGRRRGRLATVERDLDLLARELTAIYAALEHWDGEHPPPDQVEARVEEVEARLSELEARLR